MHLFKIQKTFNKLLYLNIIVIIHLKTFNNKSSYINIQFNINFKLFIVKPNYPDIL